MLLGAQRSLKKIGVQAPKPNITESQMNYLLKMSRVLPPFLKDLDHSVQELRKSNTQAVMQHLRLPCAPGCEIDKICHQGGDCGNINPDIAI